MIGTVKKALLLFSTAIFLFVVQGADAASLTLSPKAESSGQVVVDVLLDTGNKESVGVDLLASFDKEKLELVNVQKGTLYDTYAQPSIDNQSGQVSISGVVSPDKTYKGSGKFAQFVFKPKQSGEANVQITFKKGERNDSNVADTAGNDILTEVTNTTVKVSGKGGSWLQNLLNILIFWD